MIDQDIKLAKPAGDLGWVFPSLNMRGPLNSITDVPGVLVGHTTLIKGEAGPLDIGRGPVRTGVTAIRPHLGDTYNNPVAAAVYVLNGYGKTIGLEQIRELGILETPILLTSTLNVWRCADALVDWVLRDHPEIRSLNPVVGECNDSWLNDNQGRHITKGHVFSALENSHSGPVEEGNFGAGTGTICYQFKGGIGSSSRVLPGDQYGYTVGVLVQTNFGFREQLIIRGQPMGQRLKDWHGDELKKKKKGMTK